MLLVQATWLPACVGVLAGIVVFSLYGDHRDLHVLTHSFPTRRSSDLTEHLVQLLTGNATEAITRRGHEALPTFGVRSEEHTSELQSLLRISYAVFCLKKQAATNTGERRLSGMRPQPRTEAAGNGVIPCATQPYTNHDTSTLTAS